MVICLERGADLHIAQLMLLPLTVSCSSLIGFTFLVPAHPRSPGQRTVKRVCVMLWAGTAGTDADCGDGGTASEVSSLLASAWRDTSAPWTPHSLLHRRTEDTCRNHPWLPAYQRHGLYQYCLASGLHSISRKQIILAKVSYRFPFVACLPW